MSTAQVSNLESQVPLYPQSAVLHENMAEAHLVLARFNQQRLMPQRPEYGPGKNWRKKLQDDFEMLLLEAEVLEWEREEIQKYLMDLPQDHQAFMTWFENLKETGPGQNDALFDWLEHEANHEQMTWFTKQEVAGEAGFDDLTALSQVKLPVRAKLEVARNYWDEMGRGQEKGMHGPMLESLAQEMKLGPSPVDEIVPESLALGNILLGLALNRRYAYHSLGALGAVELTAPSRAVKVYRGLKRLGFSSQSQRYYLLHSTLDVKHSEAWNKEVIEPLIQEDPSLMGPIAEGALMRLNAGARCFRRYRSHLWIQ